MVCEAAETHDWVVVEGQGSLTHPGFSGVTLGLVHGSAPDLMILCHDAARTVMKGYDAEKLPLRSLSDCIRIYEDAAAWRHQADRPRARVVAVSLNTAGVDENAARAALDAAGSETGLPAVDPVRGGAGAADRLADALLHSRVAAVR